MTWEQEKIFTQVIYMSDTRKCELNFIKLKKNEKLCFLRDIINEAKK